jgi:hypothetical protein
MTAILSTRAVPASARIRVDALPDAWPDAGLLATAASGITDGTSNTIMFASPAGTVFAGTADSARVWGRPDALKSGFGLLLPAASRLRFRPGAVLPTMQLLPYIEQDNLYKQSALTLERVRVASVTLHGTDVAVWLVPAGIIAVLIGL